MTGNAWDVARYRDSFGFVTSYGDDVLALLDARPGESVLDLGCGSGEHAAALTERRVRVVGVDADPGMLAAAREAAPDVPFHLVDTTVDEPALGMFDAVFSNAALHWMQPQDRALRYARACLTPGGRFVAEMGGHGNVEKATAALMGALASLGLGDVPVVRNWFPSIPVQSALLEDAGFEVVSMLLFDRPTPLGPGLTIADWTQEFRSDTWAAVPKEVWPDLRRAIDERAAPDLLTPQGWSADYRRLRFVAIAC